MRILIYGMTGMLGHALWKYLSKWHETYGTTRLPQKDFLKIYPVFLGASQRIIYNVDVLEILDSDSLLDSVKPDVVINAIGIIKHVEEAKDPVKSMMVNSLFPQRFSQTCARRNVRFIHISTDCVFSGNRGNYSETDSPDPVDLYGKTKYLGEVENRVTLTLRTSIIGPELRGKKNLLEWFFLQKGKIEGYKRVIFSGFTTDAFAEIVKQIIEDYPALNGLYHLGSDPIDKYSLLVRLKDVFQKDIEIVPTEKTRIDRSLNSDKFKRETKIQIPSWEKMLSALAKHKESLACDIVNRKF